MSETLAVLREQLKELLAEKSKLRNNPAGRYAIKHPHFLKDETIPEKHRGEKANGSRRSAKEARVYVNWVRHEDARLNKLILMKKKQIETETNMIISNLKTDIRAAGKKGMHLMESKLQEQLKQHQIPSYRKFQFLRAFYGQLMGKPKIGDVVTFHKGQSGEVYKERVVATQPSISSRFVAA